jgi:hypothetical protein
MCAIAPTGPVRQGPIKPWSSAGEFPPVTGDRKENIMYIGGGAILLIILLIILL